MGGRDRPDEAHLAIEITLADLRLELPAAGAETGDEHTGIVQPRQMVEQPPRELAVLQAGQHRDRDRARTPPLRQLETAPVDTGRNRGDAGWREVALELPLEG